MSEPGASLLAPRRWMWFLPAAIVIVAMRVAFFFTPITADEGAFLAVARAWRSGARLYRDTWADRPQGQFVLYRALDVIGLGNPVGIRLLGVLACLVAAAACGRIAARLAGRRAAWVTALVVGVFASVPRYEAFITNGEILSCSLGAIALALVLRGVWDEPMPRYGALVAAGVFGGAAVSIKQTGFDAMLVGLVVIVAVGRRRRWPVRERLASLGAAIGGILIPIGLLILHAALTGWHRWWFALVTYRSTNRSVLTDADWRRFLTTGWTVAPVLLPAAVIVIAVLVLRRYRGYRPTAAVLAVWSVVAFAAFVSGGQFFRHYWMILMLPLGTVVGVIVGSVRDVARERILLAVAIVSPLAFTLHALTVPRADAGMRFSEDRWAKPAEKVADWFEANDRPGDRIYAFCAAGALYGNLSVPAPFPYVWLADVRDVPGAVDDLVTMLGSPERPRFVAVFQEPAECDESGRAEQALRSNYDEVTTVEGIAVFERNA